MERKGGTTRWNPKRSSLSQLLKSQPNSVGRVDDKLGSLCYFGSRDWVAMGQVAHGNGTIVSVVSACTLLALQNTITRCFGNWRISVLGNLGYEMSAFNA
ncbi:hypothetical protein MTP99_000147 [Tenebrio molitor]|nr:hypothetical protein MTP99_000147 [Tenebrio molitor]